jgi:queuine tRNA-ribosyltransferase
MQWEYLTYLSDEASGRIAGLAFYDPALAVELANHAPLRALPRLSLAPPSTPHQILRQIALGMDVFATPLVNQVSDAGVALSFSFPAAAPEAASPPPPPASLSSDSAAATDDVAVSRSSPLGFDMWTPDHRASLAPLVAGCPCYTCTRHHRAYVHHLLRANEMLGWTLLQIHNHHVVAEFFAGVRCVLAADEAEAEEQAERDRGTAGLPSSLFEKAVREFSLAYDVVLPEGTGTRPRARGYHFKSEAGQKKFNESQWKKYGADGAENNNGGGGGGGGKERGGNGKRKGKKVEEAT